MEARVGGLAQQGIPVFRARRRWAPNLRGRRKTKISSFQNVRYSGFFYDVDLEKKIRRFFYDVGVDSAQTFDKDVDGGWRPTLEPGLVQAWALGFQSLQDFSGGAWPPLLLGPTQLGPVRSLTAPRSSNGLAEKL